MNASIADVCIVGVGAVGGILAKQLTSAGLKVIALERGPALRTAEYAQRDSISYIARPDQLEGVRHEPRIFRTSATEQELNQQ
jgi:gluconate 2-dehydrogenase alpha chain